MKAGLAAAAAVLLINFLAAALVVPAGVPFWGEVLTGPTSTAYNGTTTYAFPSSPPWSFGPSCRTVWKLYEFTQYYTVVICTNSTMHPTGNTTTATATVG